MTARDPVWLPFAGFVLGAVATFLFGWWLISGLVATLLDLARRVAP